MAKRLWDKGTSVNERVHQFTVGNDPEIDTHIFSWDILASAAHAHVLLDNKILTHSECLKVLAELKRIFNQAAQTGITIPKELEDGHTLLESLLTERLKELGKKIHTGRSRNDQVLVAIRLFIKSKTLETLSTLVELTDVLFNRAKEAKNILMPGYTHFQPAMPSSVDMWLQAFAEHMLDHIRDGLKLFDRIDANPLGAASGFYVPLKLNRSISSKLLRFKATQRNPIHIQNLRGREELAVTRWWSDIASSIEKMAFDFILFSSHEYGFFSLPNSFTTGSSIMPQKRNPDVLELLRASASQIRAATFELEALTSKLPSSYHRDFQFTKEPLIRAAKIVSQILPITREVINEFAVNEERLKEVLYPDLFATYQVYRLVRQGKSFREAYMEVAKYDSLPEVQDLIKDYKIIAKELENEFKLGTKELDSLNKSIKKAKSNFSQINKVFSL
jgi:argininosuccinate lyase